MAAFNNAARNGPREEEEPQQENNRRYGGSSTAGILTAALAAGGALAWGISRVLSNNTETQPRNHHVTEPSFVNSPYVEYEAKQLSRWSPPHEGCYKMNTDGGCHPARCVLPNGIKRGPSGYGGILRDHNGKWFIGFRGFIGESDNFTAELQGILKGLELLDKLNIKGAILETDHESLCKDHINGEREYGDTDTEIVRASREDIKKCRGLMFKNGITVKFVPGKYANECADKLADIAIEKKQGYMEIKYLPYELKDLVERDAKFIG